MPIVSAAARALAVLECLSRRKSVGHEELSRELGLAKPTVSRFLQTLQGLGYARRDESEIAAAARRISVLLGYEEREPTPIP